MGQEQKNYIVRAERSEEFRDTVTYPWNPDSVVAGTKLSVLAGLQRLRVSVVRVPPGGAATAYHSQLSEEEWWYVLSGKGVIEIDDQEDFLSPGDFVGIGVAEAAHQLRNPFREPLICLHGGEYTDVSVSDYPRLGKRMFRYGETMEIYDTSDVEEIGPADLDEVVRTSWRRSLRRS
ncbi:MAG: cupin domain-containing protein [Gammaproteobacteria bacterium]|nr:cupin domain-containing protein [Gammaproteobacteria bacterium]